MLGLCENIRSVCIWKQHIWEIWISFNSRVHYIGGGRMAGICVKLWVSQ